jgi:lactoylglutathione lyase
MRPAFELVYLSDFYKICTIVAYIVDRSQLIFKGRLMQLAYTILYVQDVRRSTEFYAKAFGLKVKFIHESGDYGEMDTGSISLAFCSVALLQAQGKSPRTADVKAPCSEIAFTTSDVPKALTQALAAGAVLLQEPEMMAWGQTVAYLADPDGFWVELCTPMG